MTTTPDLRFILINQDGARISGITTYVCTLARNAREVHVLFLNESAVPDEARAFQGSCSVATPETSHDVDSVARTIVGLVTGFGGGRIVIMPNTGDTPYAAAVAAWCSLGSVDRARTRILGTAHGDHPNVFFLLHYYRAFLSGITAVSRRCAVELRARLGDWPGRVTVLPCPVEPPAIKRASSSGGPLRLVYCGRLEEEQKRVSRLAELVARLEDAGVHATLSIAGTGPAEQDLRHRLGDDAARRLVRVVWLGSVARPDVPALLASQDIFLLVSAYEGTPIALLESMAARACPVVMRTVSGIPDVVTDGDTGVIVDQGDAKAMASAIADLDRDRVRLERLKSAASASVIGRFSVATHLVELHRQGHACFDPGCAPREDSPPPLPQSAFLSELLHKATCANAASFVVFGAGMFGRKLVDAALAGGLLVCGIVDSDPGRHGAEYRELPILPPDALLEMGPAQVLVGSIDFSAEIGGRITAIFEAAHRPVPQVIRVERGSLHGN